MVRACSSVQKYYNNATAVISNPMDFQTMLRKVKQKSYRSKREFQDDLDLIWSNCYSYNASEVSVSSYLFLSSQDVKTICRTIPSEDVWTD
jgi:hypothetical protein